MKFYTVLDIGCNWLWGDDVEASRAANIPTMIKKAAGIGANAVKFQYYDIDEIKAYEKQQTTSKYTPQIYSLIEKTQLDIEQLTEIKAMCDRRHIDFMCTPFVNPEKVEELDPLVDRHKVRERDSENKEMLTAMLRTQKPFYVSTTEKPWVKQYIEFMPQFDNLKWLFCIPEYPASWDTLWKMMPRPSDFSMYDGYSNHIPDVHAPIFASTMAALFWPEKEEYYLEVHFMLEGTHPIDEAVSFTPSMVKEMCQWTERNEEIAKRLQSSGEPLKLS